jgi:hypothetical protein
LEVPQTDQPEVLCLIALQADQMSSCDQLKGNQAQHHTEGLLCEALPQLQLLKQDVVLFVQDFDLEKELQEYDERAQRAAELAAEAERAKKFAWMQKMADAVPDLDRFRLIEILTDHRMGKGEIALRGPDFFIIASKVRQKL